MWTESGMLFNNLLWFGFLIINLSLTVVIFRYFGKFGLYAVVVCDHYL